MVREARAGMEEAWKRRAVVASTGADGVSDRGCESRNARRSTRVAGSREEIVIGAIGDALNTAVRRFGNRVREESVARLGSSCLCRRRSDSVLCRWLPGYLVLASGCATASETWALVEELQAVGATIGWRRLCTSDPRVCGE